MAKSKTVRRNGATTAISHNGMPLQTRGVYFLSLKLTNVRCFGPEQTLDLSDGNAKPAPWTIILGLNGTGKTTILQSLVGFEPVRKPQGDTNWRPRFGDGLMWEQIKSFCRGEKARISATIASSKDFNGSVEDASEWWCEVLADDDTHLEVNPEVPGERAFPGLEPLWICAYGAGRRLGAASLAGKAYDDPTDTLFSDRADLHNPEEWLLQLDYAAYSSKEAELRERQRNRFNQVTRILLKIMPDIREIQLTPSQGPQGTPQVRFATAYGWVPLRSLGYGYQTLITWVADLAFRMCERWPASPDPLAEPAVVAVDEIDLHLHPRWQRLLMEHLTTCFPRTQFIATAHSPLVAQVGAYANLAVLRRNGDHVVIDNELGQQIRGWRVDQILTSDLFGLESARPPQIEKLLKERKQLLMKPKLTNGDKQRVKELEAEIGDLPVDSTAEEIRERQEIRKALDGLLKARQ